MILLGQLCLKTWILTRLPQPARNLLVLIICASLSIPDVVFLLAGANFPPIDLNHDQFPLVDEFSFVPISSADVVRAVSKLKNGCKFDVYGISATILKSVSLIISPILADLFNNSLQ